MKAVPGILPTLLEMICFFSTPTIDVEPKFCLRGGVLYFLHKISPILAGFFRSGRAVWRGGIFLAPSLVEKQVDKLGFCGLK